jgi:hypothetical protein
MVDIANSFDVEGIRIVSAPRQFEISNLRDVAEIGCYRSGNQFHCKMKILDAEEICFREQDNSVLPV